MLFFRSIKRLYNNYEVLILAFSALTKLIRTKLSLGRRDDRKMSQAVEYILRDAAAMVGILPESESQTRPGACPDSTEAGSLTQSESCLT